MRTSKLKIHGLAIPYLIDNQGDRFWPMRPVCEAMGLNWHSQAAKLHPPRYSPREHDLSQQGQPVMKRALCLPQSEFEFWLKSLNPRKVSQSAHTHINQLCAYFFGEPPQISEQALPPETSAPKVLRRILQWRMQQSEPSNRKALLKELADQFSAKNGFAIADTQEHQLRGAVASLSTIIYLHDRSKTPSQMPVSQRVDTIIRSIVDARPQRIHLLDSDFAALLCSIELEGQHSSYQNERP